MPLHTLLDIQHSLVSPTNPSRADGSLDVERCAKLHNYLVALSWMERHQKGPEDLDELLDPSRWSYFSAFGSDAEQVRERLDPQLCQFLESIIVPRNEENSAFFVWVQGIAAPEEIQNDEILEVFEAEDQQTEDGVPLFALLYPMNMNLSSHPLGVVYHQELHRVVFVNTIFDAELVNPPDEHEDLWVPLEHLLSHWINLVQHHGKVTIGPKRWEMEDAQGVWRIEAFGEAQVTSTLEAFNRLVSAIEQRMEPRALLDIESSKPLLTDEDLDAAGAPAKSFARYFLTRARTPRFTRLAPGIEVPHDASAFASRQKFTRLQYQPEEDDHRPIIPSVVMFASSEGRTANFDSDDQYINKNPFPKEMHLAAGDHSTPAGLYSESVKLGATDIVGEGFRLLLPFSLQGGDSGAKMSDGLPVNEGSVSDLFQHGTFPLGRKGSQRLERLFDAWTDLVERGVWSVGIEGVEGSWDKFRDADNGSWSDYWIAPDTTI